MSSEGEEASRSGAAAEPPWPAGAGAETPREVLELLALAYGEGEIGGAEHLSLGGQALSEEDRGVLGQGHGLTYGELLPAGVSKALGPGRLVVRHAEDGLLLELGMGTGKVALQAFLECLGLARVLGVELAPSRYAAAEAALRRLAAARPERFALEERQPGGRLALREAAGRGGRGRELEILQGSFFDLPAEEVAAADVLLVQVMLPGSEVPRLQRLLLGAKEGGRALLFDDPAYAWALSTPAPLHRVDANISRRQPGDPPAACSMDLYATSWLPEGRLFFLYQCDRSRAPSVTAESAAKMRRAVEERSAQFGEEYTSACLVGAGDPASLPAMFLQPDSEVFWFCRPSGEEDASESP